MPQVDLRPLFSPPSKPKTDDDVSSAPEEPVRHSPVKDRPKLDGSEWANVAFVIAACAGAIFSAAFLFRGGALLQEVAAWPRELFTGRPVSLVEAAARDSIRTEGDTATLTAPLSVASPNDSGDPFSSAEKLLRLDRSPAGRFRLHDRLTTRLLESPVPPQSSIRLPTDAPHNGAGTDGQVRQTFSAATADGTAVARAVAARSTSSASRVSNNVGRAAAKVRAMSIAGSARTANAGNAGGAAKRSLFNSAMQSIARSLGIAKHQNHTAAESRSISTLHRAAAHTTKQLAASQHAVPLQRTGRRIGLTARHKEKALANGTRQTSRASGTSKRRSTVTVNTDPRGSAWRIKNNAPANATFTRASTLPSPSQAAGSFRGANAFGFGRSLGNLNGGTMRAGVGPGGGRGR